MSEPAIDLPSPSIPRLTASEEIRQRDIAFVAEDGFALGGTLFEGGGDRPLVLISSATAVPRGYYAAFARALCKAGARAVLTYDYRGLPGSPTPKGWNKRIGMKDWAVLDMPAAAAALDAVAPGHAMAGVGQSYGGQALGLCGIAGRFTRYGMVATMSGYHRGLDDRWAGPRMFLIGVPVASLLGRVPRWLGIGEPIPASVFRDWARWCRRPDYFFGDPKVPETAGFADGDHADPGARPDRRPLGNAARHAVDAAALRRRAGRGALAVARRRRRADRPSRLLPLAIFGNAVAASSSAGCWRERR